MVCGLNFTPYLGVLKILDKKDFAMRSNRGAPSSKETCTPTNRKSQVCGAPARYRASSPDNHQLCASVPLRVQVP